MSAVPSVANARAAAAESAVLRRYVGHRPGFAWARSAWPPVEPGSSRGGGARWHYWWSAHLIDAMLDAARHRTGGRGVRRARAVARGVWLRNGCSVSRPFWDDVAWFALALDRFGADTPAAVRTAWRIGARLDAAIDPVVGAVPWHVGSRLFNAPANGPAAILLARLARTRAATGLADWTDETLTDPATGLVFDGVEVGDRGAGSSGTGAAAPRRRLVTDLYTYCQGVAIGADLALAARAGDRHADRASRRTAALAGWLGPALVLPGRGGGDGGLFAGITTRYLAQVARAAHLVGTDAAATASVIVHASAAAVWDGRVMIDGAPVFSADWRREAAPGADDPERDLSVQLGAWTALEAAVDAPVPA